MMIEKNKIGVNEFDSMYFSSRQLELNMRIEHEFATKQLRESKTRLQCLKRVYPKMFKFPDFIKSSRRSFQKPTDLVLVTQYEKLTTRLTQQNPACIPTFSEKKLHSVLTLNSKKLINKSLWIGTHCVDIFIPNLHLSDKSNGIAIEVDGDVHNHECKMKKDERKAQQLTMLGIPCIHIDNLDIYHKTLEQFMHKYGQLPTLDTRARRRLWTKIHAFTLAVHLDDNEFYRIFRPTRCQN